MPTAPKPVLTAGYQQAKSGHVHSQQQPLILNHIPCPGQGETITLATQIFRIATTVLLWSQWPWGYFVLATSCKTATVQLRMRPMDLVSVLIYIWYEHHPAPSKAVPEQWWELHCIQMRAWKAFWAVQMVKTSASTSLVHIYKRHVSLSTSAQF